MNCAIHTEIPATAYCRNCGKPLCENCKREVGGVVYCEPCIATRMHGGAYVPGATAPPPFVAAVRTHSDAPNPGLALGLGFIPGVGAMYNGQIMKGFIHVGVFALLIAVTDHAGFFGIFIPFFVFYMAIDAYQTARAKERGEPLPDHLGLSSLIGPAEFQTTTRALCHSGAVRDAGGGRCGGEHQRRGSGGGGGRGGSGGGLQPRHTRPGGSVWGHALPHGRDCANRPGRAFSAEQPGSPGFSRDWQAVAAVPDRHRHQHRDAPPEPGAAALSDRCRGCDINRAGFCFTQSGNFWLNEPREKHGEGYESL